MAQYEMSVNNYKKTKSGWTQNTLTSFEYLSLSLSAILLFSSSTKFSAVIFFDKASLRLQQTLQHNFFNIHQSTSYKNCLCYQALVKVSIRRSLVKHRQYNLASFYQVNNNGTRLIIMEHFFARQIVGKPVS